MKSIQKWVPGLALLLAVLFSGATAAQAATPTVFASGIVRPNGITASSTLLLVAPQSCPVANENSTKTCGFGDGVVPGPTTIYSLSSGGVATAFTTLETGAVEDQEIYMATATGGNGWGAGDVYAARGKFVYKIATGGVSAGAGPLSTHFATPCTLDNQHVGITFDTVGTFGFSMIITCGEEATTWKVSPAGAATVITASGVLPSANQGQTGVTEGPAVTPATFCPSCNLPISYPPLSGSISAVGSRLFVTQENRDEVHAITSGGAASTFNNSNTLRDPEAVLVVPNPPCTFSTTNQAYFIADQTNNVIISYPLSDFAGLGGNLLIPNEAPHTTDPSSGGHSIYMVNGTNGALSVFDPLDSVPGNPTAFINHEGSAFVTCITPPATMPIIKKSSNAAKPPTNADFLFGLYVRNNGTFANPPVGVATTDFPAFSYLVNVDGTPAGAVRGTLITTPPETGLLIPLANGTFFGAVCELKHTAGWTFSTWTATFSGTPISGTNSISAAFHPTGETVDPQIFCVNLTIQPGTTNVELDVTDTPPLTPTSIATTLINTPPLNAPGSETDSVQITHGAGPTITGNVTYNFFTNGTCTAPANSSQTVAIAAGVVPNSSAHTALAAGSYSFNASYAGDSNYAASGPSACEPFTVNATGTQFCSPGYWKNHDTLTKWGGVPDTTTLGSIFNTHGRDVFKTTTPLAGVTFIDALNTGGGGYTALSRDVVNAYLGSIVMGSKALYSTAQVISMANAAYAGDGTDPFTGSENCPLN